MRPASGLGSVARLWTFFRAEAARFSQNDAELRAAVEDKNQEIARLRNDLSCLNVSGNSLPLGGNSLPLALPWHKA
ncbi:hypothetical protein T484DRAFT_1957184 [Baffinella frigidus]|nr:hypothetical protein T484DRAFT_1957184 [Cryptophyta sp. CCMP2293]